MNVALLTPMYTHIRYHTHTRKEAVEYVISRAIDYHDKTDREEMIAACMPVIDMMYGEEKP